MYIFLQEILCVHFLLTWPIRKWGSANGLRMVRMAQICEWAANGANGPLQGQKKKNALSIIFSMASAAPPPARLGAPPEPVGHLAAQNEEEKCVF